MTNIENVFTFTWNIENFSMLPHQVGEYMDSSKFTVDFWKEVDFCLRLYPRCRGKKGFIMCNLVSDKHPEILDLKFPFLSITLESIVPSTKIMMRSKNFRFMKYAWAKFLSFKLFKKNRLYLPQDTLTLRCHFKPLDESTTKCTENDGLKPVLNFMSNSCVSRTIFPIHRRSITWPIPNINKQLELQKNISIQITSPSKESPSLNLSMIFDKNSIEDCIQIEIKQTDLSPVNKLFAKCKITVVAAHTKFQDFQKSTHLFSRTLDDKWKFPAFIKTSNLTCEKYLFVDDTLLLQCDFAFTYTNTEYHVDTNYMPFTFDEEPNRKPNELSTSLENLYTNKKFCDIELKTCGKTLPFYKFILRARSSVFSAMLEKEISSSIVEIADVDPDTLNRMLTFMCSGVIKEELSVIDAGRLYEAADKYDVVPLKSWCTGLLASSLSVSSVCDVLLLADSHHDNLLMSAVRSFIQCHAREIFRSTHWEEVMNKNPKLSREIMLQFF